MAIKVVSDEKYHQTAMFENDIAKDLSHPNIVGITRWFVAVYRHRMLSN